MESSPPRSPQTITYIKGHQLSMISTKKAEGLECPKILMTQLLMCLQFKIKLVNSFKSTLKVHSIIPRQGQSKVPVLGPQDWHQELIKPLSKQNQLRNLP